MAGHLAWAVLVPMSGLGGRGGLGFFVRGVADCRCSFLEAVRGDFFAIVW